MGIKGFQGTSLLDYPGRIASLIFFGGCNLRCPYCHNAALVLEPERYPDLPVAEVLEELAERRGFIDGVVVTGGEPTLAADLLPLLQGIKQLGLPVKLDTNGLAPGVLQRLLADKLVDTVALDLKTAPERYGELGAPGAVVGLLRESLALTAAAQVPVEFRTTCVPGLVEQEDICALGAVIADSGPWVLQQFVPGHAMTEAWRDILPYSAEALAGLADVARRFVPKVKLRGG